MEKVKLHRCKFTWLKTEGHGCWRVQRALDEGGIPYELVKVRSLPRSARTEVQKATGQVMVPAIEFADGSGYRAESAEMAERIRAGKLFEGRESGEAEAADDGQ